jgi:putative methyltransferase (TIGR04325 family)
MRTPPHVRFTAGAAGVVRSVVRAVTPAGLLDLRARWLRRAPIWEGVFDATWDPGADLEAAAADWVRDGSSWLQSLIHAHESGGPMPSETWAGDGEHRSLLAAATVVTSGQDSITIFDFGGGLGDAFIYLRDSLPRSVGVEYHIRDLPLLCREGRALLSNYPEVRFHEDGWPRDAVPDVVYANGSLQFARDFRAVLRELTDLRPGLLLLVELPAGNKQAFVTRQRNLGRGLPAWIFELAELRTVVEDRGYELVLDARAGVEFSQAKLPPGHRITDFHTLLWARGDWLERRRGTPVASASPPGSG